MILDLAMKINRNFGKRSVLAAAFAAVALVGAIGQDAAKAQNKEVGRKSETARSGEIASTDAWVEDGFPLIYRRDRVALEAIWNALDASETERAEKVGKTGETGKIGTSGKDASPNAAEPFAEAVDFQLRRQGPKYKGKTLALRGRLLRAVWIPTSGEVGADAASDGFYDLWILLPDSKRDPVRLLTRRAPPGFKVDERLENASAYPKTVEYRRETVAANAVYYRTTAFDGGDDFYAAPTLVAVDFRWSGDGDASNDGGERGEKSKKNGGAFGVQLGVGVVIVVVWLLTRRKLTRKWGRRGKRAKTAFDLPDSIEPFAVWIVAASALVGAVRAETPEIGKDAKVGEVGETAKNDDGAEFWSVATGVVVDAWRLETGAGEPRPALDSTEAVERRRIAVAVFERLARLVSPSTLAARFGKVGDVGKNGENGGDKKAGENGNGRPAALVGTLGDYVATIPADRPVPVASASVRYFCGTALQIDRLPTGADEAARIGGDAIYRVVVALDPAENGKDGGNKESVEPETLVVYSPNVPKFAAPSSFFDANAKKIKAGDLEKQRDIGETDKSGRSGETGGLEKTGKTEENGVGERVGGLGVLFGRETTGAVALAARVGWFPSDAALGRLGVDLSTFEGIPVYPIRALAAEKDPARRRKIARALRWTTADSRPFYEALAAVRRDGKTGEKRILTPSDAFLSELETIVALFNRPEENQGRVVKLRGRVRRANLVLVDDPDVVAATGIDRYYQLYLFSNDSQGWPLVLCVPELPDGLKTGGGGKYRREIEFVGAFTKTWAYRTSAQRTQTAEIAEVSETVEASQSVEASQTAQTAESSGPGPWGRVPVLIGRVVRVVPEAPERRPPVSSTALVVGFAVLFVAWRVLRRRAAAPSRTGRR